MAQVRQTHSLTGRAASSAGILLSTLSALLISASARPMHSGSVQTNQKSLDAIRFPGGKLSAERSLLQLTPDLYVWTLGDSDPAVICTVLSDGVSEKWQPSPKFVQQLGSATKLILSQTDSTLKVPSGIDPFFSEVHPNWNLADSSKPPAGAPTFLAYNGAPNRPVVFAPNWTPKSGFIQGSNFWMFGVAPGTSEKDVASLAMIKLAPGAQLAFTYIGSAKALPAGYQWYQATQPIGN